MIHLQQNVEYCFVLLSNSQKYYVYVAKLGEFDVTNPSFRITKQPHAGVMFKSQNGSTWTPDQERDIKFTINRANFTSLTGKLVLNNEPNPATKLDFDPLVFTNGSNIVKVQHRSHGLHVGSRVTLSGVEGTTAGIEAGLIRKEFTYLFWLNCYVFWNIYPASIFPFKAFNSAIWYQCMLFIGFVRLTD